MASNAGAALADGSSNGGTAAWPNPPLERSIFGWDPVDEFSAQVGEWLLQHAQFQENVEIEAKVGRIISRDGERIHLPVRNETIVEMQSGWRFESTMSDEQHKRLNMLLNKAVEDRSRGIRYERQHEIDLFFRSYGGGGNVRVTKDEATMKTKEIMVKKRIADMNIYCPNHSLDYRISVNIEQPRTEEPNDEPDYTREKNRLHYTHQRVYIDLTQVHTAESHGKPTNELELEHRDAVGLIAAGMASTGAAARQEWTPYYDEIQIFLNSVRMIIRNAA